MTPSRLTQRCIVVGLMSAALLLALPHAKAQGAKSKSPASSAAASVAQARREIQANYQAQDAAFARSNVDGVFAGMAPDCELINKHGKSEDPAALRQGLGRFFSTATSANSKTVITQFSMDKDGATVTNRTHSEVNIVRPSDGAKGQIVSKNTGRDFWVKTGAGWRVKRSREVSTTTKVNGHTLPD